MPKYNEEKQVTFTYNHCGAEYEINATFRWDAEWDFYDMEIIGPDGDEYTTEFKNLYERIFARFDYESIYDVIVKKAEEEA